MFPLRWVGREISWMVAVGSSSIRGSGFQTGVAGVGLHVDDGVCNLSRVQMAYLVERKSKGPKKQARTFLGLPACVAGHECRGVLERQIGSPETSSLRLVFPCNPNSVGDLACLGLRRAGSREASPARRLDWLGRVSLHASLRLVPVAGTGLATGRI